MISGWTPWLFAVAALGALLTGLLINDPQPPDHAHNMQTVFYPEPTAKPGYTLTKERIGARNVSAYVLSKSDLSSNPRPAVILSHGGGITDLLETHKPQYKGEFFIARYEHVPYSLAEAGFLVVAIDNWWAGERYEPKHAAMARAEPFRAIVRGWVQTRHDISSVIDELEQREDVDPGRIGIAGWSGGGFISLLSITHDPRVNTAVAWKAGPDMITKLAVRGQGLIVGDAIESDPDFLAFLEREDPIHHYANIPPRTLALIGNYEDPAVPRVLAENFVEKLRPLYADHPERLRLSLYRTPQPTHDLAPEPLIEGCDWLIRWLSVPEDEL